MCLDLLLCHLVKVDINPALKILMNLAFENFSGGS